MEKKVPLVPYAKLGGKSGVSLSRAAFALILKFSEHFNEFVLIVDMIELRADEMVGENEEAVMLEIVNDYKQGIKDLQKKWEKASLMRKWLNEKKSNLSHKFSEQIKKEFEEKKEVERLKQEAEEKELLKEEAKEEEKKPDDEEEIQIDTSSKQPGGEETMDSTDMLKFRRALTMDEQNLIMDMAEVKV
mmetsp:Transcript_9490/g.9016  ORF Transcript_9490/g.9016 Transcript_9490/m.9016 type:complete len:189 (-) Transcript_9490:565-1131(-)